MKIQMKNQIVIVKKSQKEEKVEKMKSMKLLKKNHLSKINLLK